MEFQSEMGEAIAQENLRRECNFSTAKEDTINQHMNRQYMVLGHLPLSYEGLAHPEGLSSSRGNTPPYF